MILTKERAAALHADKIFLKVNNKPPSESAYGPAKIGHDFKVKDTVHIEERTGIYQFPYIPCAGGVRYSGLFSIGLMSYSYSALPEPMSIGRYCSIASGLVLLDSHHPLNTVTSSILAYRKSNHLCADLITEKDVRASGWHVRDNKPWPTIGHDVWIGRDVTIAMGVRIGTGSVIAANSVVTKDVPPYAIVGGNPAAIVRASRFGAVIAGRLLDLEWWKYRPSDLVRIGLHDPGRFVDRLAAGIENGSVEPYRPTTYIIGTGDHFERLRDQ